MRPMNKAKDWVLSLIIVAYLRVRHPIFGHFCRSNLFTNCGLMSKKNGKQHPPTLFGWSLLTKPASSIVRNEIHRCSVSFAIFEHVFSLAMLYKCRKCFAHIRICVSIFTYICILCFFGVCHGEAIHGCSEMVSSPLKDPCLHTWNNLKKHASSAVIGSVWEITLAPSPVVILMEGRVLLQPCHTLSKSRCVPSFAHQVLTPMDALYISKPFIANNKRPSKNTLQPVCLTPWRIGFCCHGSFCRRFHVDLGVPEVCMWSFPESCLAWHRWSRRLQLDIRGILVPFRWEASVFCC